MTEQTGKEMERLAGLPGLAGAGRRRVGTEPARTRARAERRDLALRGKEAPFEHAVG
ncbi:hypothetical protein GCM10009828_054060 [Actinoplanes couchii]|uniref:Uncharacterized protein n=1 Tax=Actinoplanes couchii TaxID=403638 RepID=A0ABQ3XQP6_9ACTN|nr:hypothetical protein Aco03nite_092430 [Actinoplanes couchii]